MSRVYFHSPSGEAELWGGERAWLSRLCNDVTTGIMDIRNRHERIGEFLSDSRRAEKPEWPSPYPDYYARFSQWCGNIETSLNVGWDSDFLTHKGHPIDAFTLVLNTACRVGGNALKLAARIHGQCELHCWTEGADRAWLAGIVDEGLTSGVFRSPLPAGAQNGWENVAEFLLSRQDEPVVLSYSVCERFPNQYTAGWEPPEDAGEDADDLWYDLPSDEQWRLAMDALRQSGGGLQLKPGNWEAFHFDNGLSMLDLLAGNYEERLDRALGITAAANSDA